VSESRALEKEGITKGKKGDKKGKNEKKSSIEDEAKLWLSRVESSINFKIFSSSSLAGWLMHENKLSSILICQPEGACLSSYQSANLACLHT
jgi:hypothetical protein